MQAHIYRLSIYIYTHINTYTYVYIHIYMGRERERERETKTESERERERETETEQGLRKSPFTHRHTLGAHYVSVSMTAVFAQHQSAGVGEAPEDPRRRDAGRRQGARSLGFGSTRLT